MMYMVCYNVVKLYISMDFVYAKQPRSMSRLTCMYRDIRISLPLKLKSSSSVVVTQVIYRDNVEPSNDS